MFAAALAGANSADAGTVSNRRISAAEQAKLQQAMAEIDHGDTAEAEALLRKLRGRYPYNFDINESLGLIYAGEADCSKALPLLVAAARERPGSDVAHANLGVAYLKLQRTKLAAAELERAAQLNPADDKTQIALGQAWMLLNQPHKAATAFNAALVEDPLNSDLLYDDALAEFDDGQWMKAATLLARMPNVESSASAQSLYGDVEEKLGRYKEATQHYADAATLVPSEANHYILAIEFLRHWTFGPAITEFSAGVRKFPESQRMRMGLAIAYYGNGNYDKAIPVLVDLLAADPGNAIYAGLLGRTCTVLTEGINPRCAALVEFAEQHPQNATLGTYAATSILHRPSASPKDLETAGDLLRQAVAADPKLAEAQFETGVLLQTESKWQQSTGPLETAVRLKPDYAKAHYRLARAYSHTGQREDAQKQIALFLQYSKQQQENLDARMKEITTLVVKMQ